MKFPPTLVLGNTSESHTKMLPRSNSSASLTSPNTPRVRASKTTSSSSLGSVVINMSRSAPSPSPLQTSSVSLPSLPEVQDGVPKFNSSFSPLKNRSRGQSFRAAPPPPKPVSCSSSNLDRSLSLRSVPLPLRVSTSSAKTESSPTESLSRRSSFRAAPPPPPSSTSKPKAAELHNFDPITSRGSNGLLGSSRFKS